MSSNGRVYNLFCIHRMDTDTVRMSLKEDDRILQHSGGLREDQLQPLTKKLVCLEDCGNRHCGYKWHEGEDR